MELGQILTDDWFSFSLQNGAWCREVAKTDSTRKHSSMVRTTRLSTVSHVWGMGWAPICPRSMSRGMGTHPLHIPFPQERIWDQRYPPTHVDRHMPVKHYLPPTSLVGGKKRNVREKLSNDNNTAEWNVRRKTSHLFSWQQIQLLYLKNLLTWKAMLCHNINW